MPNSPATEALFIRLYLDRHIVARLAIDLRSRGYDVLRTEEAGLDTAPDEDQLVFATREKRAILTFNIRDFVPIHVRWLAAGQSHGGIIVSRQLGSREYGTLLGRMLRLLNHYTAEDLASNMVHLEQFK